MKEKWIAFLCWFLGHRMAVNAQWWSWGGCETRLRCARCGGNETWENDFGRN